ncbi:MAG: DUF896 domain-containing protein [Clostridia bacterium]|nr:DUF896 domain-containing protein [Clostridia bacterium]
MMTEELIKRINELAKKSKAEGLTDTEKAEQAELRAQYIAAFRQGVKNTLNNVYIVDEQGNEKKLEKKSGDKCGA